MSLNPQLEKEVERIADAAEEYVPGLRDTIRAAMRSALKAAAEECAKEVNKHKKEGDNRVKDGQVLAVRISLARQQTASDCAAAVRRLGGEES